MATVAELGIDIDATDRASRVITKVDALLRSLGAVTSSPTIDPETAAAEAEIAAIEKTLSAIDGETARADVEVDSGASQAEILAIAQNLARIDGMVADATADVDVDGMPELEALHAELQGLDAIRPVIGVDIDTLKALAQLDALRAQLNSMQDEHIDVDVDITSALVELDILELKLLRATRDRNIDVDVDWPSIDRIAAAATRASGQVRGLTAAIVALGPALVPITGVALAGIGALGAGLVAAAGGAALFAGVAYNSFSPIVDVLSKMKTQQDAYNRAVTDKQRQAALEKEKALWESLDPAQQAVATGMLHVRDAWNALTDAVRPQIFATAARGMEDVARVIPRTEPLLRSMTVAVDHLLTSLEDSLASPFWQRFFANMERIAGPATESLLRAMGNIVTGIAGILNAFVPMSLDVTHGFEDMTRAFAEWGAELDSNEGFRGFTEYIKTEWPRVKDLIHDVWNALIDLIRVAAPIGADVVDAVAAFARGLSNLADNNPRLLETALRIAGIGFVVINLLGPLAATLASLKAVASTAGFLTGVTRLLSAALGISIVATLGWAAAILAAGAALVVAYAKLGWFRDAVDGFAGWIVSTLADAWSAIGDWLGEEVDKWVAWWHEFEDQIDEVVGRISDNLGTLGEAFAAIFGDVTLGDIGEYLATMLGNALQLVGDVLAAGMEVLRGIFTVGLGLLALDWQTFWDGLVITASGIGDLLLAPLTFLWDTILNLFGVKQEELRGNWDKFWSDLASGVSAAWEAVMTALTEGVDVGWTELWARIETIARDAWDSFWATLGDAQANWDAMIAALQEKLPDWETLWGQVKELAQTSWDEFWTDVQNAQADWDAMVASLGESSTWEEFWSKTKDDSQSIWTSMWEEIKTEARTSWESITQTTQEEAANWEQVNSMAADFVRQIFTTFWETLQAEAISAWQSFTQTATEELANWEAVNDAAANLVHDLFVTFWETLQADARQAWQDFVQTATEELAIWEGVNQAAADFVQGILEALWAWIVDTARSMWQSFLSIFRSNSVTATGIVEGMGGDIMAILLSLPGRAYAAMVSLGESIARGIRSKIRDVLAAAGELAAAIVGPLPGSPAEWGPLSGQGYALLRAQRMVDDIARGLGDTTAIQRATNDIADLMALELAPGEAYRAIAEGRSVTGDTGGRSVVVEAGAVQVSIGDGVDPEKAREEFSDAAEELADLIDALQRR